MIDERRRDTLNHLSQNVILITSSKEMGQPIHKLKIFQTKQKKSIKRKTKQNHARNKMNGKNCNIKNQKG